MENFIKSDGADAMAQVKGIMSGYIVIYDDRQRIDATNRETCFPV